MSHAPYDNLVRRNQELVAAYKEAPNTPRAALARHFGVSLITLDRILRAGAGDMRKPRQRAPAHELRSVSNLHRCLGAELERRLTASGKATVTAHAYASKACSPQRLCGIFAGVQDITLSELQALAAYLSTTPHEILTAAAERESKICPSPTPAKATG